MINQRKEDLLTLKHASRAFPTRPHSQTISTWIHQGLIQKETGVRVKLESLLIGGERRTSMEAYYRFCDQLNRRADEWDEFE